MVYGFASFELDEDRHELRREGSPVPVPPKLFSVLVYLIERRDRMVPKSELLDAFWPGNVTEAALQTTISQLRKVVGDDRSAQAVIRTHHGQGFRFVAEVVVRAENDAPVRGAAATAGPTLRERRLAAVLCVRLSETPAPPGAVSEEQRQEALERAHGAAQRVVAVHQGKLLHIMIDGFTAAFGLGPDTEDGARRAVYCAKELADSADADQLGEIGLAPGFAIDTGHLDVAEGAGETAEWAPPNLIERGATELARIAAHGEILMSAATLEHLRDEVETDLVAEGFRLRSIGRKRAGVAPRPSAQRSDFVGRSAELAFLAASLNRLHDGRGQAVVLTGPPGIGKSRLVTEFLAGLDAQAMRTVMVNCLPGLINSPLALIREMCGLLFADLPEDTLTDPVDRALLRDLRDDDARPDRQLAALSDHQRRQRSVALLDRLLKRLSQDQPLVIVAEDIHWIDASSRDLLERLAQKIDRRRVLIVMTTRPSDAPAISEAVVQLSPLGRGEARALLRALPEAGDIAEPDADTLVSRAAGNPFYLEELALAVRAGADPVRGLPDTVHAVISARIGALDEEQRALLYVIAVIGPPAPIVLAGYLLSRDTKTLEEEAEALVKMGFLREGASGFSFRHMLINDTAYAMLAPRERKRLHGEIAAFYEAEAAEAAGAGKQGVRPETLAWHFQESGQTGKAIACWTEACRFALRRSAHPEAVAFAENGIALIDPEADGAAGAELELQLSMALALTALRGFGAAEVGCAYARAQSLSRAVGSAKASFQVNVGLWVHNWVLGQLSEALDHAQALLDAAGPSNSPALKVQAHASAGEVLVHTGQLAAGLKHLQAGMQHISHAPPESIPAQNAAVACASYAGWASSMMGASPEALAFLDRSGQLSEILENPFAMAIHCSLGAETCLFEDRIRECLALAERAVAISREHGFAFWLGTGLVLQGWALGRENRLAEGLGIIDEGISEFEATGAGVQLANWYGIKAETLLAAGRAEQGLVAVRHALDCAERTNDMFYAPRIHATAAALHRLNKSGERAAHHTREAQALAEAFGMKPAMIAIRAPG